MLCQVGVIDSAEVELNGWPARCHGMPSITDIEYDKATARLTISFATGPIYEYVDVPSEVAASFRSAFSKGTFFEGYIRDRYDFRELTAAS